MDAKRLALVVVMIFCLGVPANASAGVGSKTAGGVIQKFGANLLTAKADGSYTFQLTWDTTSPGGVAPAATDVRMRLPAGVEINKPYLRGACNIDSLKSSKSTETCKSSLIGKGHLDLDFLPFTSAQVPADVYVYLAAGSNGSAAQLAILAIPNGSCGDPGCKFVAANPVVANTKPVLIGSVYRDPGNGFGYRIDMPVDIDAPVLVSVRHFDATFTGPTKVKRAKGKKLFWVTSPNCKSSNVKFSGTFSYIGIEPIEVPAGFTRKFKCAKTR